MLISCPEQLQASHQTVPEQVIKTGTLLDLSDGVKSTQIWPDLLYLVRHGESAGNVAREAALKAGEAMIDIDIRDVDVPLSELGQRQAIALGRWF